MSTVSGHFCLESKGNGCKGSAFVIVVLISSTAFGSLHAGTLDSIILPDLAIFNLTLTGKAFLGKGVQARLMLRIIDLR